MDEIILEIAREMQPISSQEIWMEIGENIDLESNPSQEGVSQILDKMEKEKILESTKSKNQEEKYTAVEK